MNDPRFSFIVPVYNTQHLLPRCIDSILCQDGHDLEILLIDDGSTDESYAVCQDYAARYPFVHAVTKPNEGQGVARNLGIDKARGDIVCFVDSDDWIDPAYCKTIDEAFRSTDADFVNFGCTFRDGNGKEVRRIDTPEAPPPTGRRIFLEALLVRGILSSPWSKAFRQDFLKHNKIRFPPLRANEDILFSCLAAHAANRTAFIPATLYHVLVRPGSTSRAMSPEIFRETVRMVELGRAAFARDLRDPGVALHFDAHVARIFSYLLFHGAARLRTAADMDEAFVLADKAGLARIVRSRKALALLPRKNRMMARFTARRAVFRPVVRLLRKGLIRAY